MKVVVSFDIQDKKEFVCLDRLLCSIKESVINNLILEKNRAMSENKHAVGQERMNLVAMYDRAIDTIITRGWSNVQE